MDEVHSVILGLDREGGLVRAIALEALGQLHEAQQQPEAAAPLIAEAAELRRVLAAAASWPCL